MDKKILGIVLLIGAIAGVAMLLPANQAPAKPTDSDDHGPVRTYRNERFGFAFDYTDAYVIEEHDDNNAMRYRFDIVLMDKDDYAELKASTAPREGPPSITISVFQNNIDKQSLLDWVTGSAPSNWKLSNGTYASTTVAGQPAVYYAWDGLYRGDTLAFVYRDNIYSASVTSLEPSDEIRHDFDHLMQSFRFER